MLWIKFSLKQYYVKCEYVFYYNASMIFSFCAIQKMNDIKWNEWRANCYALKNSAAAVINASADSSNR